MTPLISPGKPPFYQQSWFLNTLVTAGSVLLCLLLVAMFMTPAMVDLVGQRRFAGLERKRGGSLRLMRPRCRDAARGPGPART